MLKKKKLKKKLGFWKVTKTANLTESINIISIIDLLIANGIGARSLCLLFNMTHKFPCAIKA